jgi:hypothetical protein
MSRGSLRRGLQSFQEQALAKPPQIETTARGTLARRCRGRCDRHHRKGHRGSQAGRSGEGSARKSPSPRTRPRPRTPPAQRPATRACSLVIGTNAPAQADIPRRMALIRDGKVSAIGHTATALVDEFSRRLGRGLLCQSGGHKGDQKEPGEGNQGQCSGESHDPPLLLRFINTKPLRNSYRPASGRGRRGYSPHPPNPSKATPDRKPGGAGRGRQATRPTKAGNSRHPVMAITAGPPRVS